MDTHSSLSKDDDQDLSEEDSEPNTKEQWVLEDSLKNVDFIIDLSSTEHVEDLKEHKEVEDEGQMSGWSLINEMFVHFLTTNTLN